MSHDDLLNLFNVKPSDKAGECVAGESVAPVRHSEFGEGAKPSPTALELDAWDKQRGDDLNASLPALSDDKGEAKHSSVEIADFHAAAFKPEPQLVKACESKERFDFMKTLLETPEYKSLHECTALNTLASEMATVQFADQYGSLCQKKERRQEKQRKSGKKTDPQAEEAQWEVDCLCAAGRAVRDAQKEVDDFNEACEACGLGSGGDGTMNVAKATEMFKRVRRSDLLKKICEQAGKFRRYARGKQRQKVAHGYGDLIGVAMDDTIERLLDEELAALLDDDLGLDALRRLSEREMLAGDYRAVEPVGKGPIVVCVDESGSMQGDKIVRAKAFALTMAWIAKHQKRWICLASYSGGTDGVVHAFPPNKWDDQKLLDWLEHFFGHGTDMDVPLRELPTKWWPALNVPKGKTDVILITDAIVNVPREMRDTFNAWKKANNVRCVSLILAGSAGQLDEVSDEIHLVRTIDTTNAGVDACLSI